MATLGTVEVQVWVDASRVAAVTDALTMLCNLVESYGHAFTERELAVLAGANAALESLQAEPIDTRPTFELGAYVLWDPGKPYICEAHGIDHHAYTHGCHPVAFARSKGIVPEAEARPCTPDAVPSEVYEGCPFSKDLSGPHRHHDFRWVD